MPACQENLGRKTGPGVDTQLHRNLSLPISCHWPAIGQRTSHAVCGSLEITTALTSGQACRWAHGNTHDTWHSAVLFCGGSERSDRLCVNPVSPVLQPQKDAGCRTENSALTHTPPTPVTAHACPGSSEQACVSTGGGHSSLMEQNGCHQPQKMYSLAPFCFVFHASV